MHLSTQFLTYLFLYPLLSTGSPTSQSKCKVAPSSIPKSKWDALNTTLSGALLAPPPPGGVCFPAQPNYNSTLCPIIQQNWTTSWDFVISNPVQVAYQNWVNDTCWPFPDQGATCSGAGLPVYSVNASSAEHVVAAVDFARENAVRLVVKGTGHDFRGRSTAPESLSIWTHFITGTTWHDDFEIGGESLGPAVTVPAGENHLSAFETAKEHGYMVVAGGGPTVGEGGFALGGGHGLITVKHGLAVDNILQARIVTPDGKLVTINEQENTDLFWAVRGGGGSTFGVMIDLTIRAFPMESFTEYSIVISAPFNYTKMYDVLAYMAYQFPRIAELNVMSYTSIAPPVNDTQQWAITSLLGGLNYTAEEASGILDPLTNGLNATFGSEVLIDKNVTFYDTIWDWWSTHLDLTTTPIGVDIIIGSRILDAKALQNSSFAKAFETASAGSGSQLYLVSGPGSRQHTADYNSLLPAWRTGYVHALLASGWPPGNETAKAEQIDLVTNNRTGALRELAPDTGSYMNEGNSFEPNFQEAFWGSNYDRLLKIKKEIDPDTVFYCQACVGSEGWTTNNENLLCQTAS